MRRAAPLLFLIALLFPDAAGATLPGRNGTLVSAEYVLSDLRCDDMGNHSGCGAAFSNIFLLPATRVTACAESFDEGCRPTDPSWSPDGRRVAWSHGLEVVVADATGREVRRIQGAAHPCWAPDGRRLAFTSGGVVYRMSLHSGLRRRVTRGDWCDWSSRNRIALVRDGRIWSVRSDGGGARRLAVVGTPWLGSAAPSWSPDGRRLAFSRRRGPIVTVAATGGPARSLGLTGSAPTWSPDGRRIAFGVGADVEIATLGGRVVETIPWPKGPGEWLAVEGLAWQPRPAR